MLSDVPLSDAETAICAVFAANRRIYQFKIDIFKIRVDVTYKRSNVLGLNSTDTRR